MLIQRKDLLQLHAPCKFLGTIFLHLKTNCLENSHCSQLTEAKREVWQPAGQESSFVFSFCLCKKKKQQVTSCSTYCLNNVREMQNWVLYSDVLFCFFSVLHQRKSLWCTITAHLLPEGYKAPETRNKQGLPIWCHKPLTLCFTAHTRWISAPCCIGALRKINTLDILC